MSKMNLLDPEGTTVFGNLWKS